MRALCCRLCSSHRFWRWRTPLQCILVDRFVLSLVDRFNTVQNADSQQTWLNVRLTRKSIQASKPEAPALAPTGGLYYQYWFMRELPATTSRYTSSPSIANEPAHNSFHYSSTILTSTGLVSNIYTADKKYGKNKNNKYERAGSNRVSLISSSRRNLLKFGIQNSLLFRFLNIDIFFNLRVTSYCQMKICAFLSWEDFGGI